MKFSDIPAEDKSHNFILQVFYYYNFIIETLFALKAKTETFPCHHHMREDKQRSSVSTIHQLSVAHSVPQSYKPQVYLFTPRAAKRLLMCL